MGGQHCPLGLHALWGCVPRGWCGGGTSPGGGWPATVVRGVWCQALSLPRLPVPWGGQPGYRDPCVPGAVGAGVGTQHRPHGSRLCGPALRAAGVAEGRSRCEGCLGSGAPPPPAARPLGGLPGLTTHWLWVRGGPGVGTRHQPLSARSCELALRAVGVARGRPGGAPPAWVWGVRGRALSQPRLPALWAGCRGPLPTGCGCGGDAGMGTRHQPHSARSCALWGWHEGAQGGRLLPGCGASGVGRSPTPDCLPSGRAAGARYPLAVGAGGCGRGDPSPTPQRALLRAGFARCGGDTRAPGGGAPCLGVGHPGSGALPSPTPALWAGCWGPLPTRCGCGGVRAGGPVTNPTARAATCCGGGMTVPGGGASCLGVGRPGSGALPPPTARPLGGLPGPTIHWLWVRDVAGVGTRHQPHSGRSCELAVRAVGAARGRPGGAPPVWVWGFWGRALSQPQLPALWAGCRSPLPTGCGCGGLRAWGPVTNPTARALACCGGGMRMPRWGASCLGVGRPGPALSHPRLPALWAGCRGPLPTGCGCGGVRAWGPVTNPTAPALARCGGGMRVHRGGAFCLGVGRQGSGALPTPSARPLGGLPVPNTHWLWVRGGAGVGTRHQPHSARSCELALCAVGAA